jgi:beta-N-acetylhexosaminidase
MKPIKQAFGDHLILGLEGDSLTDDDRMLLEQFRPIGILFLERNFLRGVPYQVWFSRFISLLDEIRELTRRDRLILSIDHEGDRWVRTPSPITRFPVASLYRERSFEVGKATALELASLGLNLSWAPVCDVHSNPTNPIIGPRAFGTTANEVGEFASEYYRGLRAGGIEGCVKHFPGHGDTSVDSHLALPVVAASEQILLEREIAAFQSSFRSGVPFVMTAHVQYPALDQKYEATRSKSILTDLLRSQCGFNGVVVSDDLEMKAVSSEFCDEQSLESAFLAGCDLFIVSRYIDRGRSFVEKLAKNFHNIVDSESVALANGRIGKVIDLVPQPTPILLDKLIFQRHAELALSLSYL